MSILALTSYILTSKHLNTGLINVFSGQVIDDTTTCINGHEAVGLQINRGRAGTMGRVGKTGSLLCRENRKSYDAGFLAQTSYEL